MYEEPSVDQITPHTGPPIELRIDWGTEGVEVWPVIAWGRVPFREGDGELTPDWQPMVFSGNILETVAGFRRARGFEKYTMHVNGEVVPDW